MSRDVNRRVRNRSAGQSIAFQAARSGAQQVEVRTLRDGGDVMVVIDEPAANEQARRVADRLFVEYDVDGSVQRVSIDGVTVTVEVKISDPVADVIGVGSARAEAGS